MSGLALSGGGFRATFPLCPVKVECDPDAWVKGSSSDLHDDEYLKKVLGTSLMTDRDHCFCRFAPTGQPGLRFC